MARPLRDGVDYFPFDVGFLRDTKLRLIKGEFGAIGVFIYLYLLCAIYEENGYYKEWSDDVCILVSEEVGCGCNFSTVAEIVQGLIRRSLFDERVANTFGVLTSAGIQRRFLRAASQRDDIPIIQEYWLLNKDDKKDVPAGVLNKLAFKSVKTTDNLVKTTGNPVKKSDNHKRKVKESKVKESKGEIGADAPTPPVKSVTVKRHKYGEFGWVCLSDNEYTRLVAQYKEPVVQHYIQYIDESAQRNGNKNGWKDWNLTVRTAIRNKWGPPPPVTTPSAQKYDNDKDFLGR